MKKKKVSITAIAAGIVALLALAAIGTYAVLQFYVVLHGQMIPRNREELDLRSMRLTLEEFDKLSWQLPETKIVWSVPLSDETVSSDAEEITISHLSEEDVAAIGYLTKLRTVHAPDCTDYSQLRELTRRYGVNAEYSVPINGVPVSSDADFVAITELSRAEVKMLECLPKLSSIDGTRCREYELMEKVQAEHPEWNLWFDPTIAGQTIDHSTASLELTGAQYEEMSTGFGALPELKTVQLHDPAATAQDLLKLRVEYPNVAIFWDVTIDGTVYPDDTKVLDLAEHPIGSVEKAKEYASRFPLLETMIVDSKGIADADMAAFRAESPFRVIWTVQLGPLCALRTDATAFCPHKQEEYYFQDSYAEGLRYCEDMVCLDLSHSSVENIDFVSGMPHLKYLSLSWTNVTDITPLSNCKELIFLELAYDAIEDYAPLRGCTALEDLNIDHPGKAIDVEPITQLRQLKNLWAYGRNSENTERIMIALCDTHIETKDISSLTGHGWRNLPNYYDMRDYLGMHYEQ